MISESELQNVLYIHKREDLEFSLFGFLIYGWYGWILYPIIGIIFSPILIIRYSIICLSFKKGMFWTKKKIYLMFQSGLGYKIYN